MPTNPVHVAPVAVEELDLPGIRTTVFIPGNVEHRAIAAGTETLRIRYVFAADSFSEVEYVFP